MAVVRGFIALLYCYACEAILDFACLPPAARLDVAGYTLERQVQLEMAM